jgi:hypothetical protein
MVCIGERSDLYCNGKTVGLPVAMATLLILTGKLPRLEQLPIRKEVYQPILKRIRRIWCCF